MNIFKKVAKELTTLSELMQGREKTQIDELIKKYPEGFTIADFDITTLDNEEVGVFVTMEEPNYFCFAGLVLTNIFKSWIALFEGDIEETRNEYAKAEPCKVKAYKKKVNNSNKTVTAIDVI